MSSFRIKPATEADIAAIAAVGSRAWASNIFSFEPELPGMRSHVERAFQAFAEASHANVLVAAVDGHVLGWGARDENNDYISDLWVDPAVQGQGIGSAILRTLKRHIADAGYLRARISTHARNVGAIRLYEREGFRVIEQGLEWSTSLEREIDKVKMLAELQ
ncbi:GNAT family N-acetyltransferase [Phyllobacterium endophyticum]|uniref:GNAT family N-acetyltransferase n=1 Tax=Phyllobacterium endophyticum TaxID=1149773 RepID=A0A2P7AW45_9HYPH|nr:GNAT family N-acetyltransferase [Phyllobacterium endophyticum]MBB3235023.1 ribosomal-protein-alanine N-acetyltransferase [Phyllobacterium endophyticum]PSH58430.1 GNAT family N-acetyltransferase [Phyllobacterium endophyticum]TXR47143.1 GNAT family N-acetyltransferase [Phyllobacterium endophyticum]TYR39103.1 GNAT family N-acetyltransferase [Phyllobacterium endophyticum]